MKIFMTQSTQKTWAPMFFVFFSICCFFNLFLYCCYSLVLAFVAISPKRWNTTIKVSKGKYRLSVSLFVLMTEFHRMEALLSQTHY